MEQILNLGPKEWWFLAGIILIVGEAIIPGIVVIWFGIGAMIVALTAWIGLTGSINSQLTLFLILSFALVLCSRTIFRRFIFKGSGVKTNSDEMIGKSGIALDDINSSGKGYVRIGHERWLARSSEVIPKDSQVEVVSFEGITLEVKKSQ